MAVYKIFPTQDATMYSMFPQMNTGIDEIIEATTTTFGPFVPNPEVSRFLIQFDSNEMNDIISTRIGARQWDAYLQCYAAVVTGLNEPTTIDIFPSSQSWNNGTGKYLDQPVTTDGVSWVWTNYSGSIQWTTASFNAGSTGSYSTTPGGGVWYSNISSSQLFQYSDNIDLNVSVKNIVSAWYTGSLTNIYNTSSSLPNKGFIVKQANQDEFIDNPNVQVEFKFFSIDTNTIYPPQLEFRWNDTSSYTGSTTVTTINTDQMTVVLGENPGTFYSGSINKFRVNCRPTYPPVVFQTASIYLENYYLPTESYWSLKDLSTNEVIIDYSDPYTKLSTDISGSFFTMYMNGLEPERNYQILIKTIFSGSVLIFNDDYYFKVVNG